MEKCNFTALEIFISAIRMITIEKSLCMLEQNIIKLKILLKIYKINEGKRLERLAKKNPKKQENIK